MTSTGPTATTTRPPPERWSEVLRQLGPGLIITASIVGSGELIVTTKLGAEVGFTLLWFIILGCLVKVLLQVELGRHAILEGIPTLEIFDRMPGPRLVVSWINWLWLFMFLAVLCQVSGIVGATAEVFFTGQKDVGYGRYVSVALVAGSCIVLLLVGKYALIQRTSTIMVCLFTGFTVAAVGALYAAGYGVSSEQVAHGLSFRLPADITTAVAAFGIIGVGATELIYYPYWCVEKGYARFVGPRENTREWEERARGWVTVLRVDAWLSATIYTLATIAFYVLGAAVLHAKNVEVADLNLIASLSHMYSETFGATGYWVFLVGAFVVLYSTFFVSTASNARLLAHALSVFRVCKYRSERDRVRVVRIVCVLIPTIGATLYLYWATPVKLVLVGAVAQALMLVPLAFCGLYLRHCREPEEPRPGRFWAFFRGLGTFFLWVSCLSMASVGLYKVFQIAWSLLPA